jgi:hypothetical protein
VKYNSDSVLFAIGYIVLFTGVQTIELDLKGTSTYPDLTGLVGLAIGSVGISIMYFIVEIVADYVKYHEFL